MQYTLTINQPKAIAWGLNAQQALLFAFVYGCPSWARPMERDGQVFYALSKQKIVEELPLLTDKPDTAYRMLRALHAAELIEQVDSESADVYALRITDKGRHWDPSYSSCAPLQLPNARRVVRRSTKKPIPKDIRAQVFERDGHVCLRCGSDDRHRLRADHIVPESKGGPATLENLQTLCMSCNTWKAVKTIDFRRAGARP